MKTYEYDTFGRLVQVTLPAVIDPQTGDPTHPIYQYAYDAQGNQTVIRDSLLRETHFSYDDQGRQLTRTLPIGVGATGDPDDFVESFSYDDQGRLDYQVSFEGVVTSYLYDDSEGASGRLVRKNFFPTLTAYNNGAGTPSESVLYKRARQEPHILLDFPGGVGLGTVEGRGAGGVGRR